MKKVFAWASAILPISTLLTHSQKNNEQVHNVKNYIYDNNSFEISFPDNSDTNFVDKNGAITLASQTKLNWEEYSKLVKIKNLKAAANSIFITNENPPQNSDNITIAIGETISLFDLEQQTVIYYTPNNNFHFEIYTFNGTIAEDEFELNGTTNINTQPTVTNFDNWKTTSSDYTINGVKEKVTTCNYFGEEPFAAISYIGSSTYLNKSSSIQHYKLDENTGNWLLDWDKPFSTALINQYGVYKVSYQDYFGQKVDLGYFQFKKEGTKSLLKEASDNTVLIILLATLVPAALLAGIGTFFIIRKKVKKNKTI